MGCDIHSHAERRVNGKWEVVKDAFTLDDFDREYYGREKGDSPFRWRSYSMFGFLAGVRSWIDPIDDPRGFPKDASDEVREVYLREKYIHTPSFLTAKELLKFNYDKPVFKGSEETYRDNLSILFFTHLDELAKLGDPEDVRIVFWFDN